MSLSVQSGYLKLLEYLIGGLNNLFSSGFITGNIMVFGCFGSFSRLKVVFINLFRFISPFLEGNGNTSLLQNIPEPLKFLLCAISKS